MRRVKLAIPHLPLHSQHVPLRYTMFKQAFDSQK